MASFGRSVLVEDDQLPGLGRLTVRSLNIRVGAVKGLLRWAVKTGRIGSNPLAEASRVGQVHPRIRALTIEGIDAPLVASPEPDRTIWLTFLATGIQKGELVGLRWPAVSMETGTIRVYGETSKSGRDRDIPLAPDLLARLAELRKVAVDLDGPVFATRTGRPMVNNLPCRLKRDLRKAGIDAERVSLHTLRHSFATHALLNGANIVTVSRILGHATIQLTVDTYTHVLADHKVAAIDTLPYAGTSRARERTAAAQGTSRAPEGRAASQSIVA